MKATIIPSDGVMLVDGEAHRVEMTDMPSYLHAVQWDETYGELEFAVDEHGRKLPNLRFVDFAPFGFMVERWRAAKRHVDHVRQAEQEKQEARRAAARAEEEAKRSYRPI